MNIDRSFKLAKNASTFSDCELRVGAIITFKNKVISVGYNMTKSNPLQKEYNKYRSVNGREFDTEKQNNGIHAECMAIKNATRLFNGDLSKCNIFVYSERKDGSTRLSKPCKACQKLLIDHGIKNVYYTTNNNNLFSYEKLLDSEQ